MEVGKVYFSLAEVMEETGLPASTLRYWETKFPMVMPRKDGHGNRSYTREQINTLKRIRYLRDELHITRIAAIEAELKQGNRQTDVKQRATEILRRVREELVEIRSNL